MTQTTIHQGADLIAKVSFAFKVNGKGRTIAVRQGQRFWVTNSVLDQQSSGIVTVDRHGRGCISHGYAFSPAQMAEYFAVQS